MISREAAAAVWQHHLSSAPTLIHSDPSLESPGSKELTCNELTCNQVSGSSHGACVFCPVKDPTSLAMLPLNLGHFVHRGQLCIAASSGGPIAVDARISVLPASACSPAARMDCCFHSCSKLFCSECRVAKRLPLSCRKGLPHPLGSPFTMGCALAESKLGRHCCAPGCAETGSELHRCRPVDITGMQLAGQGARPGLASGHGAW